MTPKRPGKMNIWVSDETAARLRELGDMGESYDVVIRRLLEGAKEPKKWKKQ
jgi:predicted CopG family antitoxin